MNTRVAVLGAAEARGVGGPQCGEVELCGVRAVFGPAESRDRASR